MPNILPDESKDETPEGVAQRPLVGSVRARRFTLAPCQLDFGIVDQWSDRYSDTVEAGGSTPLNPTLRL